MVIPKKGVSRRVVPAEHRSNFMHLYLENTWSGILNGSALSFIAVYLTRIGADAFQVGLLTAGPAAVAMLLALPSGWWLQKRELGGAVFWSSVAARSFYVIWVFLPSLLPADWQRWTYIGVTFALSIPNTALAVGYNAFLGAAVPPDWRGHVAGTRNALFSLTVMATSLLCGRLLTWLPHPVSYQVVFAIGALGAAMSSVHLRRVQLFPDESPRSGPEKSLGDFSQSGFVRPAGDAGRHGVGLRFLTRIRPLHIPRADILKGPFGKILAGLLTFHLMQYLAVPLFPVFWVDGIHLSDSVISVGNALLYVCIFLGSTQLARVSRRLGHFRTVVVGALLACLYPGLTAITHDVNLFLVTAAVGGLGGSLFGGALSNYLLERIPETDRPAYLAWYNVALNVAILVGSVAGPFLARELGLPAVLLLSAAGRALSALIIWRWG